MIKTARQDAIYALWDELADFDAADTLGLRRHLVKAIGEMIGACNGSWLASVRLEEASARDPAKGWRARALWRLHQPELPPTVKEQVQRLDDGDVDESIAASVAQVGRYRVNRLVDMVSPAWFEGAYYRTFYLNAGHRDAIWAHIPVNEDAEAHFGFFRCLDDDMFDVHDRDLVMSSLRGLKWLHRRQLLAEGIGVASAPLSPTERQVLHGLLQGLSEKAIAAHLDHSHHATHLHVKHIYRKYGVRSRAQLMALWLGQ